MQTFLLSCKWSQNLYAWAKFGPGDFQCCILPVIFLKRLQSYTCPLLFLDISVSSQSFIHQASFFVLFYDAKYSLKFFLILQHQAFHLLTFLLPNSVLYKIAFDYSETFCFAQIPPPLSSNFKCNNSHPHFQFFNNNFQCCYSYFRFLS